MNSVSSTIEAKQTDGHILSINNAYGFTYKPSSDNNNNNNVNLTIDKYQQIKDIEDSGLPFTEDIHEISISAGNPQNTSAITDYKAIQTHIQKIEKSINVCDIKKSDFIISSDSATDLCMDQTSFAYETCAGDRSFMPQYVIML
jgi:hypothetical protein